MLVIFPLRVTKRASHSCILHVVPLKTPLLPPRSMILMYNPEISSPFYPNNALDCRTFSRARAVEISSSSQIVWKCTNHLPRLLPAPLLRFLPWKSYTLCPYDLLLQSPPQERLLARVTVYLRSARFKHCCQDRTAIRHLHSHERPPATRYVRLTETAPAHTIV